MVGYKTANFYNLANYKKPVVDKFAKLRKAGQLTEIKEAMDKAAQKVKQAYNQCPNYEIVVKAILEHGIDDLEEHCKLTPGVPLKPMLAYPTKGWLNINKYHFYYLI